MNKYSIILPVRNGGHYIKECVSSILSQTYTHFNLHILENASTDGTTEWLRQLDDSRIILIEAERPLSIEENWGRILSIKKNEFITLIGHDDVLHPDYLADMDEMISQNPGAGLYQAHFNLIDSHGAVIRKCKAMPEWMSPEEFLAAIMTTRMDIMGTGFMMRAEDYDRVRGLPDYPNLLFADFEMIINLVGEKGFCASPKTLFSFRIHNSTTSISSDLKMQLGFERFVRFLIKLKEKSPSFDKVIVENGASLVRFYCKGLSHRLLRTPKSSRNGLTVASFIQKCREFAVELTGSDDFDPLADHTIRMAKVLDSTSFTRGLFLLFKKIYPKPVLK